MMHVRQTQTAALKLKPRKNVSITHSAVPVEQEALLSVDFLKFLRQVSGEFQPQYRRELRQREEWQQKLRNGGSLSFRSDLAWIRNDPSWRGPSVVPELEKRWVEITGPAGDAKMVINALNSGANGYMADLEDSQSPTWNGIIQGHQNLYHAVRGELTFEKPGSGQVYKINNNHSTLHVRVRGVHMYEEHVIDEANRPIPAGIFDMAMFLYHNAEAMRSKGLRPLLYIPKLQSFEEAVLIHDVLQQIEKNLGIPYGTVRVTALIETLPAILQAEEIGFGLGAYWAGLNCGRWDYIFSVIKSQAHDVNKIFPDRALLTMNTPFLSQYMQQIVNVCHSRGVHAIGGMSAFIPSKDVKETERVMAKVIADKEYEIQHGCDGAWVAHPGMVKTIQEVFAKKLGDRPNQISSIPRPKVTEANAFAEVPMTLRSSSNFTQRGLETNISVGIQYLTHWLGGTGAVAINGLMEDLATAEISRTQVWQWLHNKQKVTFQDGTIKALDNETYHTIYRQVLQKLQDEIKNDSELSTEERTNDLANLEIAAKFFNELVTSKDLKPFVNTQGYSLLNNTITKPEKLKEAFVAYQFPEDEISRLQGTRPDLMLDARLAIERGKTFNRRMAEIRADGIVAHGNFIGSPNGHSARNVIEGGLGLSWPYVGGWELNARGLVGMEAPMPDTLSVNFHEQGDLARVINRYLDQADRVQLLEYHEKLEKIKKLPIEQQNEAKINLVADQVNYLTQPMLADLEQGWGDPKKAFFAVVRCLQYGINMMHIEDQYSLKRCGHLGGKGLDDVFGWVTTMKAANLAASIFEGVHRDGPDQNVNFVARTDALSAEFIQYTKHMEDPNHPDHPYVDWARGFTADGRYLYLKKGKNPQTGRKYGLEHSARRCVEIVKNGLASHVWMETPDANVSDAAQFISLVNEQLAPYGLFARGLYNHSPSFVWDVNFYIEAQDFAKEVGDFVAKDILPGLDSGSLTLDKAHWLLKKYLKEKGDRVRGDYNFEDDYIFQILGNGVDLARGPEKWREAIDRQKKLLAELGPSLQTYKGQKELNRILDLGFRSVRHITNTMVAQRLKNFKDRLSDVGFEVHLCTLPLYPSDAYTASRLARGMTETGIHDFVINQRQARKYADATGKLTCFFHQKSTGTGYEVQINKAVGTGNVDILHGSTEHADQKKEQALREKGVGPSAS